MKKYKVVLIGVLLLAASVLGGCISTSKSDKGEDDKSTLEKIKKDGVLTVASSNDSPFSYVDVDTNEYQGIDAEIIKEIASRMGIKEVKMVEVSFENLLVELNSGSVDMVVDAMYIKDERLKQAYFTDVWYKEGEAIVLPGNSDITSVDDLKDKTIGGQKGTAFLELAEQWKEEGRVKDVVVFGKQTDLMMAVNTGKVDACVTDGIVATYTLAQDSSLDLKLLENYEPEATGNIGAAVRFEDKDLLDAVNKELNGMKEDGTLLEKLKGFGLDETYFVDIEDGKTDNVEK